MGTQVFFYFCSCKEMVETKAIAASSKESTNFPRFYRRLMDRDTLASRPQFDRIHPPASLNAILKGYESEIELLERDENSIKKKLDHITGTTVLKKIKPQVKFHKIYHG